MDCWLVGMDTERPYDDMRVYSECPLIEIPWWQGKDEAMLNSLVSTYERGMSVSRALCFSVIVSSGTSDSIDSDVDCMASLSESAGPGIPESSDITISRSGEKEESDVPLRWRVCLTTVEDVIAEDSRDETTWSLACSRCSTSKTKPFFFSFSMT